MSSKKCPNCGLYNMESALRCDCGYDFPSGQITDSYLTYAEKMNAEIKVGNGRGRYIWRWILDILGWLLVVIGGLLAIASSPFLLDWIQVFNKYQSWQLPEEHTLDCIFGVPFLVGGILLLFIGKKIISRKKV
jgi:hypothetical protein